MTLNKACIRLSIKFFLQSFFLSVKHYYSKITKLGCHKPSVMPRPEELTRDNRRVSLSESQFLETQPKVRKEFGSLACLNKRKPNPIYSDF